MLLLVGGAAEGAQPMLSQPIKGKLLQMHSAGFGDCAVSRGAPFAWAGQLPRSLEPHPLSPDIILGVIGGANLLPASGVYSNIFKSTYSELSVG